MRTAIVLLTTLTLVTSAGATMHLFWTAGGGEYGLTNEGVMHPNGLEEYQFVPSAADTSNDYPPPPDFSDNRDFSDGHYVLRNIDDDPWGDAPELGAAVTAIDVTGSEFAYFWVHFEDEPAGARLGTVGFDYTLDDDPSWEAEPTYYRADNLGGEAQLQNNKKRWSGGGTMPDYPWQEQDPQPFASGGAWGIQNTPLIFGYNIDEWNLWDPDTHTALLGCVKLTELGEYGVTIPYDPDGTLRFIVDFVPVMPVVHPFQVVPEPASFSWLGLSLLLVRRR